MMSKSQILKKIGNIIEELGEQQQYLVSTNKINLLELELFTANADFLIDHIEILKKLNDKRFEVDEHPTPVLEQRPPVIATPEPKKEEKSLEIPVGEEKGKKFSFSFDEEPTEMIFDFERKIAVEEVFDRPLNDDEVRLLEEKSNAPLAKPDEFIILDAVEEEAADYNFEEEDIEPFLMVKKEIPEITVEQDSFSKNTQKITQTIPEKEEIIEREPVVAEAVKKQPDFVKQEQTFVNQVKPVEVVVKEEKPLTLNEMLSAKLNPSGGQNNQRQAKKLEDLKAAISINDKMVFIKELFNGYNLAYSEAIEIVNRFDSFDAADNFLQKNYSIKNDWENKQVTVGRFYEYLHKKFVM